MCTNLVDHTTYSTAVGCVNYKMNFIAVYIFQLFQILYTKKKN